MTPQEWADKIEKIGVIPNHGAFDRRAFIKLVHEELKDELTRMRHDVIEEYFKKHQRDHFRSKARSYTPKLNQWIGIPKVLKAIKEKPKRRRLLRIELKCLPGYFDSIGKAECRGPKQTRPFPFVIGDALHIQEWDPKTESYTGRVTVFIVDKIEHKKAILQDRIYAWLWHVIDLNRDQLNRLNFLG